MNDFNVKKRKTLSFEEFLKVNIKVVKGDSELVNKAYSGDKKGDKGVGTLEEGLDENWSDHVQDVYDSFEELESYDETYGIAKRLGFKDAVELWEKNPKIQGTTNPKDLKVVKEAYTMDTDGGDMHEEHAKAVIARALDNSKGLDGVDLKAAFDEICEEFEVPEDSVGLVRDAVMNLVTTLTKEVKSNL